jgi:SM-20-related protein
VKQDHLIYFDTESFLSSLIHNKYALVDNLFDKKVYESLKNTYELMQPDFRPAQVGKGSDLNLNKDVRSDKILWIETDRFDLDQNQDSGLGVFIKFNHDLMNLFRRELFLPLKKFESQFAFYSKNDNYVRHSDRHKNSLARRLSSVYYLNDNWSEDSGGVLRIYSLNDDSHFDVKPLGNRMVLFLSDLEHEVLKSHVDRKSITTWFREDI